MDLQNKYQKNQSIFTVDIVYNSSSVITHRKTSSRTGINKTNTKTKTGRIGTFAAACIGLAALTGASAAPTQATPQAGTETEAVAPLSDDVLSVNVTCHEDKHYQWNVNYNAGAPETIYAVYADYRYETGGGFDGGGGSFSDPLASTTAAHYAGVLTTGIYGIGSSGTSTGHAGPNGTRVYVTVTVNGYTQEGWDDC